jgi:hypothetical protein
MPYSAVFQRCGDQDVGVAEFHEAGAFGVFDHAAFQRHGAQFVRLSLARPQWRSPTRRRKSTSTRVFDALWRAGWL